MNSTENQYLERCISRRLARTVAGSRWLRSGRKLHEDHHDDWKMEGSFWNKIKANLWLLLNDYGIGIFPPRKTNREAFFESEKKQFENITFYSDSIQRHEMHMRKPFGYPFTPAYLRAVASLIEGMQRRGICPPARILELGCGSGWLLEMLVQHGYAACGTTIIEEDVIDGKMRLKAFDEKKMSVNLEFRRIEMENADQYFQSEFDVAIFHEALHHAFDWRDALKAAKKCIKPGGWLILVNEPSWLHTFTSYRSGKIFKTLEVGFRERILIKELKKCGYHKINVIRPVFIPGFRGFLAHILPFLIVDNSIQSRVIWIYAQRKN